MPKGDGSYANSTDMRFHIVDSGPQDLSSDLDAPAGSGNTHALRVGTALDGATFNPLHHSCLCGAHGFSLELLPPEHAFGHRWKELTVSLRVDSPVNTLSLKIA